MVPSSGTCTEAASRTTPLPEQLGQRRTMWTPLPLQRPHSSKERCTKPTPMARVETCPPWPWVGPTQRIPGRTGMNGAVHSSNVCG